MEYRDRRLLLIVVGLASLLVGAVAAVFGPLEMYCFYLFGGDGPFAYEGFGFGSFMFGNLALQIMGYYCIAALALPLGYGHVKLRRWARTLALTLLWAWLVVGVPLAIVFFLILVTAKELSIGAVVAAVLLLGLAYPVLPLLLLRFYRSRDVQATFEAHDAHTYWIERLPLPVLVLAFLYLFYAVVLHVPIFFRGIFPLFGSFLFDLAGISLLTASILGLGLLVWGTLRRRLWAWWAALAYFVLLTVSAILSFVTTTYAHLLAALRFPPFEVDILQGVPLQGWHLALFFGLPLTLTLAAIIRARPCFSPQLPTPSD
jgi:hypothetical protein